MNNHIYLQKISFLKGEIHKSLDFLPEIFAKQYFIKKHHFFAIFCYFFKMIKLVEKLLKKWYNILTNEVL